MKKLQILAFVFLGIGFLFGMLSIHYSENIGIFSVPNNLLLFIGFMFGLTSMFFNGLASDKSKTVEVEQ